MKHIFTIFAVLCGFWIGTATAQVSNPYVAATNNEDGVVHLDASMQHAARPGQLLVKFHDRSDIHVENSKGGKRFTSPTKRLRINAVLDGYTVEGIKQLIPDFVMPKAPRVSKSYGGGDVVEHDLSQWHLITLDAKDGKNEYQLMEELRALDEVESVEPNYLCFALESLENGDYLLENPTDATYCAALPKNTKEEDKTLWIPNDPMYSLQWGVRACNINYLLGAPKLNPSWRPIIAIIDTGVDVDHADLQGNIWTNSAEANGATGQDDDANGFTDDVHGWDFVNQTGNMHDFNSHGTHCAGIAGAVTNNHIGIAGACPDALIMPVCVMQSDGSGDIATIIQGINYARQNGADIISMSLGTYTYSAAMEQALAVAYQSAVLVAAAGNDGLEMRYCCDVCKRDMFPAAFNFVLGVQATQQFSNISGYLAGFSNIDCTGPSYSVHSEDQLYNYELSAPGVGIISTVPNGQYRNYTGTSMACPLVAGGVASLLQRRNYQSKESLFGDLINNSQEFYPVDFWNVYTADSIAPAVLQMVTFEVNDTAYGDSSMYADAGERVQIYPTIRTVWGPADSVDIWLEFQQYEDTSIIQILQNHVQLGHPLSSYSKAKSINPIDIRINNNVVDGRKISLTICASTPNSNSIMRHDIVLRVTNGVKLHGVIQGNYTLHPNVQYIVTGNFALPTGDTLFIMPGTTVRITENRAISATIIALGKPDSIITFTRKGSSGAYNIYANGGILDYCAIEWQGYLNNASEIRNCVFNEAGQVNPISNSNSIEKSNINYFWYERINQFANNLSRCNIIGSTSTNALLLFEPYNNIHYCNMFGNAGWTYYSSSSNLVTYATDSNYYGSMRENIIRERVRDIETGYGFGWFDLSNRLSRPSPLTHGIVWKVEVNGFDAQDEFDSIIPLGVGRHEFKVYFNRAMDTSVTPMLAMGVRPPYTQTAISDSAYWSADSTIYTAYLNLTGRMPIDGLNRIYVSGAQDNEHFEIPYENQRFNVYVASSGSMSAGFQATPGIGKVDLEWNDQEVNYEDFLGFNLYRYQYVQQLTNYHYNSNLGQYVYDTITVPGDTLRLNSSLVQDTMFADYDVVPGERYYYYYKILSTSLTENSPSKTVSCVPHSTIPGDANGSYGVDVADVITTINYVTGQNPQPFLFDAADVNGDGVINVLDIVSIINIILHPGQQPTPDKIQEHAIYTVENDTLYVNSPVDLAGLQFTLGSCIRSDIEVLAALTSFECATVEENGALTMIFYSMSGLTIPAGKTALLRLGDKEITSIVLSDAEGHNVIPMNGNVLGITGIEAVQAQFAQAYPNPFHGKVRLDLTIGNYHNVTVHFTDIMGRAVDSRSLAIPMAGSYSLTWDATGLSRGVYFATLYADGIKAQTIKLIVK